ncbi:hypothetical protein HAHE_11870 [Haloferula helveola]|uniref:Uncharacterized protein n=1 Tax=Haloferula helveola TaxID=490095 RepID=A0ABM7RED2_9BACT|nr:hypothetical protein HAHE_11870 [Haloferula helveola]
MRWWIPSVAIGISVAVFPLYGHRVHAARVDQWVFIPILLAWVLTWVLAGAAVFAGIKLPPEFRGLRVFSFGFALLYLVAGFFGWGGVREAFFELVAG